MQNDGDESCSTPSTPSTLSQYIEQHELNSRPGQRVLLETFAELTEDDFFCSENAYEITMTMALYADQSDVILSTVTVRGKHLAGGKMILLDASKTLGNGDILVVSYHVRDDYTITYAKRVQGLKKGQPDTVVIIKETVMLQIDEICQEFTDLTGIELPYAST